MLRLLVGKRQALGAVDERRAAQRPHADVAREDRLRRALPAALARAADDVGVDRREVVERVRLARQERLRLRGALRVGRQRELELRVDVDDDDLPDEELNIGESDDDDDDGIDEADEDDE